MLVCQCTYLLRGVGSGSNQSSTVERPGRGQHTFM